MSPRPASTLDAVEIDLVADDDGHAAKLAFSIDRDVDLALQGIEAKGLGHLDELELLFPGELVREAECGDVVEQVCFWTSTKGGGGLCLPWLGNADIGDTGNLL